MSLKRVNCRIISISCRLMNGSDSSMMSFQNSIRLHPGSFPVKAHSPGEYREDSPGVRRRSFRVGLKNSLGGTTNFPVKARRASPALVRWKSCSGCNKGQAAVR